MAQMLESVDGANVDRFAATFSGAVEVELPDARNMTLGEELLIVARVRVKVPRFREAKSGDISRVSVLGLKELALVRSEELRKHLCDALGLDNPGNQLELDFETPVSTSGEDVSGDPEPTKKPTMTVTAWNEDEELAREPVAVGQSSRVVSASNHDSALAEFLQ